MPFSLGPNSRSSLVPSRKFEMTDFTLMKAWRAKWWLAIWVALGGFAGIAYTMFDTPNHEAAAKLLVEQAPAPLDEREPVWERNFMPTQAEIASSPRVVAAAASRTWQDQSGDPPAIGSILGELNVTPLVGSNVLSIRYRHPDPQIAANLVNQIIDEYTAFLLENEQLHRSEAIRALEAKIAELKVLEQELVSQRDEQRHANPLASVASDGGQISRDLIDHRFSQLVAAQARRQEIELQLRALGLAEQIDGEFRVIYRPGQTEPVSYSIHEADAMTSQFTRTPPTVADHFDGNVELYVACQDLLRNGNQENWIGLPDAERLFTEIAQCEAQVSEWSTRLGAKHRDMLALRRRLEQLEVQLNEMVTNVPNTLLRAWDRAIAEEKSARIAHEQELDNLRKLDLALLTEAKLNEEIEQIRAEQNEVSSQLSSRKLVNSSESDRPMTVTVRVLEEPALMPKPLVISDKYLGALGALFGLLAGVIVLAVGNSKERK